MNSTKQLQDQLQATGLELLAAREQIVTLEAQLDGVPRSAVDNIAGAKSSILFNAIPKSASTYCFETISRVAGMKKASISLDYFPYDLISLGRLERFARGGQIAHHHLDGSPVNLFLIRLRNIKTIIHIRDPRQVIVSWVHHLRRAGRQDEMPRHNILTVSPDWWACSLEQQTEWVVNHHYPVFVQWTVDWIEAIDQAKVEALLTTFEEMVADPKVFFVRVAKFCELDPALFVDRQPDPRSDHHFQFRKGLTDEWRTVLTPRQQEAVCARIPDELLRRFNWQP